MYRYKNACAVFSLFLALLLVACTSHDIAMSQEPSDILNSGSPDELIFVTPFGNLIMSAYAGTEDGCYELLGRTDGSASLLYTDYNSAQKTYLSSAPNVDPTDVNDTSYIDNTLGGAGLLTAADKLYVITLGKPSLLENYGDAGRPSITQMDLNGSNHNKLLLPANLSYMPASGVVYNNTKGLLYFLMLSYSLDDDLEEVTGMQLIALNTHTMRIEVVDKFEEMFAIVGCCERGLIIRHTITVGIDPNTAEPIREYSLCLYSLEEKKLQDEAFHYSYEALSGIVDDQYYYYCPKESNSLIRFDLITGTETILTQAVVSESIRFERLNPTGGIYDNHIIINCSDLDTEEARMFAVDLSNGIATELTAAYGHDRFTGIFLENSKMFWVMTGIKEIEMQSTSPEGIPFINQAFVYIFSLIRKEDYWSNNHNYIEIEDRVFSSAV